VERQTIGTNSKQNLRNHLMIILPLVAQEPRLNHSALTCNTTKELILIGGLL